jgi:hypothetical protein
MKIMIKNVDGTQASEWCIPELKREGHPKGSIIKNARYNESNNSFTWDNCVAWLNETCIVIENN